MVRMCKNGMVLLLVLLPAVAFAQYKGGPGDGAAETELVLKPAAMAPAHEAKPESRNYRLQQGQLWALPVQQGTQYRLAVADAAGRTAVSFAGNRGTHPVPALPPGIYFYRLETREGQFCSGLLYIYP